MIEEQEKSDNQEEQKQLTCPECGKRFQDMRGLTSHARHMHELNKEELFELYEYDPKEGNLGWKILGGAGAILLAILSAGRLK